MGTSPSAAVAVETEELVLSRKQIIPDQRRKQVAGEPGTHMIDGAEPYLGSLVGGQAASTGLPWLPMRVLCTTGETKGVHRGSKVNPTS